MKVTVSTTVNATHLAVNAKVRYWEDATVNGEEDADGSRIPGGDGDTWRAVIEIDTGKILDWPAGTTADIHYKVCDAGTYELRAADGTVLATRDGYVPDEFLCHGDRGYGDYVIMSVGPDGRIANYRAPSDADLDEEWEGVPLPGK